MRWAHISRNWAFSVLKDNIKIHEIDWGPGRGGLVGSRESSTDMIDRILSVADSRFSRPCILGSALEHACAVGVWPA